MTDVTLVACAKNEGPYLLEWIAYHRRLGFKEIVVYDNGSTDGSARLLAGLAALGVITFRRQPDRPRRGPQFYAYTDAVRCCRTEWVMFLDLDEYLVLERVSTLPELLRRFDDEVSQVGFNWRVFGSSGRKEPGEGLIIERFLSASLPQQPVNAHLKSVTRCDRIALVNVHAAFLSEGIAVHPDETPVQFGKVHGISQEIRPAAGRVHHYAVKSEAEFLGKIARGRGTIAAGQPQKKRGNPAQLFKSLDLNDLHCPDLLAVAPAIRADMAELAARLEAAEASPLFRLSRALRQRWSGIGQRLRVPTARIAMKPGEQLRPSSEAAGKIGPFGRGRKKAP